MFEQSGVPANFSADIVDHEKGPITHGLYSGGASVAAKIEVIERLGYLAISSWAQLNGLVQRLPHI